MLSGLGVPRSRPRHQDLSANSIKGQEGNIRKVGDEDKEENATNKVIYEASCHYGRVGLNLMGDFWTTVQNPSLRIAHPKSQ